jgi:hypothetical protein
MWFTMFGAVSVLPDPSKLGSAVVSVASGELLEFDVTRVANTEYRARAVDQKLVAGSQGVVEFGISPDIGRSPSICASPARGGRRVRDK